MEWPSRNYQCFKKLEQCFEEGGLVNLKLGSLVGEGSYGKVYLGTAEFGPSKRIVNVSKQNPRKSIRKIKSPVSSKVAIKVIQGTEHNLNNIFLEVEFCIYMSELGIGPKVYHSFYTKKNDDITQYIVMEPMSMSCEKALENKNIPLSDKLEIVTEMINLLEIQIFDMGLMCTDIKPHNYMVNIENNKNMGVKMIDFDSGFCKFDEQSMDYALKSERKKVFFLMMMIQLYLFVAKDQEGPFLSNDIFKNRCLYAKYVFNAVKDPNLQIKHYLGINPVKILKNISCNNEVVYSDIYNHALKKYNNVIPSSISFSGFSVYNSNKIRKLLIEWIYEVCVRFKYYIENPNIFFICVQILDRYFSNKVIKKDKLQLTGAAALYLIADKNLGDYIDPYEFIREAGNSFTKNDLIEERKKIEPYYSNDLTCYDILQILIEKIKLTPGQQKQGLSGLEETDISRCLTIITEIQENYLLMYTYKPCTIVSSVLEIVSKVKLDEIDFELDSSDKCIHDITDYIDKIDLKKIKKVNHLGLIVN